MESSSSSGSKRRRLMVSYVSLRPDLPATFESLNDDTLTTVLEFVGDKSYRSFGVNKRCKEIYLNTLGMTKETYFYGYAPLSVIQYRIVRSPCKWELFERVGKGVVFYNRRDILYWALQQQKKYVLKKICEVAAGEGRIDILKEVWNNVNDEGDKRDIFKAVDLIAARVGKLEVMKWLETKGEYIWKEGCARYAARYGQLPILQWLREEQGFELDGDLYYHAIWGGQLHVLKWLKDQEVNWHDRTFHYAAKEGNLDILQWLHDEGCPWPEDDDYRVYEEDLKAEAIDWLRSHGYGDRIVSFF